MRIDRTIPKGFTLIELLVVIAVIALLMAIVIPSLGKAKVYAQKVICKNNLRQQCLGIMLYSNDYDTLVPNASGGYWLWDISFENTQQLSRYAGFDDTETFFCAGNKNKKPTDARLWQYRWLEIGTHPAGTMPFPQEVGIADESFLAENQLQEYYRVLPIVYMLDKYDQNTGDSNLEPYLVTGEDAKWIRKLSNVRSAGSKIMVMDAVISGGNNWQFTEIANGGIDTLSDGMLMDDTNHISRQTIGTPPNKGPRPDGANIGYADSHVDWRDFDDMQHRYTSPGSPADVWFWW